MTGIRNIFSDALNLTRVPPDFTFLNWLQLNITSLFAFLSVDSVLGLHFPLFPPSGLSRMDSHEQ